MSDVTVTRDGAVATVTLNRPERRNAMTYRSWALLGEELRDLARSDARVIVLAGAGSSFCAGADLAGTDRAANPRDQLRMVGETAVALHRMPQPTIARVQGHAVGAGANLALTCDIVVAAQDAVFHQNFVQRGLSVDLGGSWLLPRLVGHRRACQILLTGESIPAVRALDWGLISQIAAPGELDAVISQIVGSLLSAAPIALAQTKSPLALSSSSSYDESVDAEMAAQCVNRATTDATEGIAAFIEKRAPVFRGQ